jgi:hypothetical protein
MGERGRCLRNLQKHDRQASLRPAYHANAASSVVLASTPEIHAELDVPTSHKCYEPEDLSLATRVCVPAYPPLYWFDCQELFMSLWGHFEGRCTDGWLLLRGRHWFRANLCVPEAFGRWLHERGFAVSYGDLSPYDGQPVPDPVGCPEVGEALMLCGGDCGPCPASFDCLGRSPLHPFGLCAPDYYAVLKGPGQEVDFWFVPPDEPATFAAPEQLKLPLDTCLEAEASLPVGDLPVPRLFGEEGRGVRGGVHRSPPAIWALAPGAA